MIKMTMFLKRKAGMSHEDFVKHHIEVHGPKFRSIPEAQTHCRRYIQTHPVELKTDAAQNANFDGTAELWFDSEDGMHAVLTSDTYQNVVFPDEKTFLDHNNTLIIVGEQGEIIGDFREG